MPFKMRKPLLPFSNSSTVLVNAIFNPQEWKGIGFSQGIDLSEICTKSYTNINCGYVQLNQCLTCMFTSWWSSFPFCGFMTLYACCLTGLASPCNINIMVAISHYFEWVYSSIKHFNTETSFLGK